MKVIIIGGGWAGCSAALEAVKLGAEVELYERTDLLLGVGNVGGIMRNNGRYTAAEELINLGAGDFIRIMDSIAIHKNIDFPEHKHAWLCDIGKAEPIVRRYLIECGVKIFLQSRITDVNMEDNKIKSLVLFNKDIITGDVFVETTGSTGSMPNCVKYGNGCVMCTLRCPSFGARVSISSRAGVNDLVGERANGMKGAMSGSCEFPRESLSKDIVKELEKSGVVVIPIPKEDIHLEKLEQKVCQQYATLQFAENIILLDTGRIKLMTSHYPLDKLRKIKGLENVVYIDPLVGSNGNSIRYLCAAPRNNSMQVNGVENLFCGGEKSGFFVGHTEAMTTGTLAGYNAVQYLEKKPLLELPRELATGDIIAYANDKVKEGKMSERYTFSGAEYFERMKDLGLYSIDNDEIRSRVKKLNLTNIFSKQCKN
ncbi:FAD-dependent oxidoreductase [Clostridium beijerinckii]|uniref:FAD-dependent oxidoreductase n=1 Tax=Clostridium beijerinckii TaxID=1520 RepID=A0A1S9N109_CLOBE|nr:FAD-dependent oxidoreductase [Clostridium beijerinckii]MZK49785.1 FAD-dependent oxidoreductase [Clostridium beijerinckii]MZK57745.1 FAD-dependent oxidoreductase [Clostridium beijerinckii]MZK67848.1 FAD-dependent oxidoreductase [Clostridium beijerinckii]MZK73453.1 FAD-dependent oxidoreductase [Clostridium beijerinckii]MZK83036.1 FAD-dependent oxidoreductase [Clostridium beijerinckii]